MSAFQRWKVSLVYLFAIYPLVSSNRLYKVIPIVTDVQLNDNLKYLNSSAQVHTGAENKVDFSLSLKRPLANPWINIILWMNIASGALKAPLQNQSINFCTFLRNPSTHRLGQIILREVKRCGNAPKKCPFLPNLYKFRGISMGAIRLPAFFPETNFIMDILVGVKDELVYDSRWYGTVKKVPCVSGTRC